MKAIVACDKNWGIGKDGDLLFNLPGDLAYFREQTFCAFSSFSSCPSYSSIAAFSADLSTFLGSSQRFTHDGSEISVQSTYLLSGVKHIADET